MAANSKQIDITVRLENRVYYRLKEYVEANFSSRNKVINRVLEMFLDGKDLRKAPR